jgi:hypothetical protein
LAPALLLLLHHVSTQRGKRQDSFTLRNLLGREVLRSMIGDLLQPSLLPLPP